jgi:glycosyltransferase involved in cell wall biosynthesis
VNILHLATNDVKGGAARSAYRLHKGLQQIGHESQMFVISRTSDDASVTELDRPLDLMSRVRRGLSQYRISRDFRPYAKSRPRGYELFSDDRSEVRSTFLKQMPYCDVINLHWVPGFIDYGAFLSRLPQLKPVVWTLHDMNPFTGGCHYTLGCDRYMKCCGMCPQLGSQRETDLSHQIWQRKTAILSRLDPWRLQIVTPSRWLASEAKRSSILGRFPVSVIPYGLNTEDFAPRNQGSVRDLLSIPREAKVVLFVAEGLKQPSQGLRASLRRPESVCGEGQKSSFIVFRQQ